MRSLREFCWANVTKIEAQLLETRDVIIGDFSGKFKTVILDIDVLLYYQTYGAGINDTRVSRA